MATFRIPSRKVTIGGAGLRGFTGATGPQGLASTGPTGAQGLSITGPTGAPSTIPGPTGSPGTSIVGPTGSPGATGASFTGPTGAAGSLGPTGATGIAGQSFTGPTGAAGASVTGPTGAQGNSITGPTGAPTAVIISATMPTGIGAGQEWWNTSDGKKYIYFNDGDSSQWVEDCYPLIGPTGPTGGGGGGGAIYATGAAPTGAADNSLWFNTVDGVLYVRYNDGDSTQWVQSDFYAGIGPTGPSGGPTGPTGFGFTGPTGAASTVPGPTGPAGSVGGATGSVQLDFGSTPTDFASLAVTDTGVATGSQLSAWLVATPTADHSADEHVVENLKVMAGNIASGTGFTIYGLATLGRVSGKFSVQWKRV